jgi:hypothetical protein
LLQGTLAGDVNQAGAIRGIKPELPEGVQIDVLVPSYELNAPDGNRFKMLSIGRRTFRLGCGLCP